MATTKPAAESATVSLRLHTQTRDRLDALVAAFAADPTLSPTGVADRSDVMRAALLEGLRVLEAKHAKR